MVRIKLREVVFPLIVSFIIMFERFLYLAQMLESLHLIWSFLDVNCIEIRSSRPWQVPVARQH